MTAKKGIFKKVKSSESLFPVVTTLRVSSRKMKVNTEKEEMTFGLNLETKKRHFLF